MKRITALLIAILLVMGVTVVANAAEYGVYGKVSYLDWTETLQNSKRDPFVKEFGPIYSIGGNVTFLPTENFFFKTELEGFGGKLSYQGNYVSTQISNDTSGYRLGATLEQTAGYKIKISNDFSVSPFASLGASYWRREVCAEDWYNLYGRLGLEAKKGMFFARGGVLLPLFTEVHGTYAGVAWINAGRETAVVVNPKGMLSPFMEIGIQKKNLSISIFYEMQRWERSNTVNLGGGVQVLQPYTIQQITGVRLIKYF